MADNNCETCLCWKSLNGPIGECRIKAPSMPMSPMGVMPVVHPGMVGHPGSRWPVTRADEGCGEYRGG